MAYTAITGNNSDKIVAVSSDARATVTIESDDATIAADGTATWKNGDNLVLITVDNGAGMTVYRIVVTTEGSLPIVGKAKVGRAKLRE